MTPRPKNMLEAFQASTHAAAQESAPPPRPVAPPVKSPGLDDLPQVIDRRRIEPLLAIAAGALLLVLAFFLGRFSVGEPALASDNTNSARAADDLTLELGPAVDSTESAGPIDVVQPVVEDDYRTDVDRAFLQPANVVTVRALRYGLEEQSRWEADYWQLKDLGLPVVQPVAARGGEHVVLCVGAEPRINQNIETILADLQAMPKFATAYVDNIDNFFER